MSDVSVHILWEIKYQDAGEEQVKLLDSHMIGLVKEFVDSHDVKSIISYANANYEQGTKAYGTERFYERSVTKEEFSLVPVEWITERLKEMKPILEKKMEVTFK